MLIYLIGFFLSYYMIKKWRNRENLNEWGDVFLTIFVSLCSWITCIILLIISCNEYLKKLKPLKIFKPPRFL